MTRERVPLDWAMTQNNLGDALRALGERESGTARLEEAVAAYRPALVASSEVVEIRRPDERCRRRWPSDRLAKVELRGFNLSRERTR